MHLVLEGLVSAAAEDLGLVAVFFWTCVLYLGFFQH